jgi:hypothetical protein
VKAMSIRALKLDAAWVAVLSVLLTAIWAVTGVSNFWPKYTLIWLGAVLVGHAGLIATRRLPRHWLLTPGLVTQLVVSAVWWLSLVAVWSVGPSSGFWPQWVLLALAVAVAAHVAVTMLVTRGLR